MSISNNQKKLCLKTSMSVIFVSNSRRWNVIKEKQNIWPSVILQNKNCDDYFCWIIHDS